MHFSFIFLAVCEQYFFYIDIFRSVPVVASSGIQVAFVHNISEQGRNSDSCSKIAQKPARGFTGDDATLSLFPLNSIFYLTFFLVL
jgi:hypothetical protein